MGTTNRYFLTFSAKSIHLKSKKPIFDSGYSSKSLLIMAGSLLFYTAILSLGLFYIRQYPVAVSLLSLFLVRTIIDAKVEKIVVLEDRFVVVTRRVFPFLSCEQVILFSTIESIHIPQGQREMFLVRYKDGDLRQLSPSIQRAQFQKAAGVFGNLQLI